MGRTWGKRLRQETLAEIGAGVAAMTGAAVVTTAEAEMEVEALRSVVISNVGIAVGATSVSFRMATIVQGEAIVVVTTAEEVTGAMTAADETEVEVVAGVEVVVEAAAVVEAEAEAETDDAAVAAAKRAGAKARAEVEASPRRSGHVPIGARDQLVQLVRQGLLLVALMRKQQENLSMRW